MNEWQLALELLPLAMIENHHNFAWKEKDNKGKEVIVHRKGATPAGKGVLGIIPGSMTAPGFIVRGKGHPGSLNFRFSWSRTSHVPEQPLKNL